MDLWFFSIFLILLEVALAFTRVKSLVLISSFSTEDPCFTSSVTVSFLET